MICSIKDLLEQKQEDSDYSRDFKDRGSSIMIIAPHGGGIEKGTSEIASALAREDFSLYMLEGIQKTGNKKLHIDSCKFDDPDCIDILKQTETAISIHGCVGDEKITYVGGRNTELKNQIIEALTSAEFCSVEDTTNHSGIHRMNICNQCMSGEGVQLEISRGMRRVLFEDMNKRKGRENPTQVFSDYVGSIRPVMDYWQTVVTSSRN